MKDFLNSLIQSRIPLAQALDVTVDVNEHEVRISAPLRGNENHMGTGFAGSLSAICILCGWAQTHYFLGAEFTGDIVLKNSNIRYLRPITSDIVAIAKPVESSQEFVESFKNEGKAQLKVDITILEGSKTAVAFRGSYTAISLV